MKINEGLARIRKEKALTQKDVVNALKAYNIEMSFNRLSRLELGLAVIKIDEFFALCDLYKVNYPLDEFSDYYKPRLNAAGVKKVNDYIEDLVASKRYEPETVK